MKAVLADPAAPTGVRLGDTADPKPERNQALVEIETFSIVDSTTADRFAEKLAEVAPKAHVDFALWGGARDPESVRGLAEAGAIGLKVYMASYEGRARERDWSGEESSYPPEVFVTDDGVLIGIFAQAAALDMVVAVHLANRQLRERARVGWNGRSFESVAPELVRQSGLEKIEAAERCLLFAAETGVRIHLVHVPPSILPSIRRAKANGVRVTAESLYPLLTHEAMERTGALGYDRYVSAEDAERLWAAMRDGTIDALATDHAPHALAEKEAGANDVLRCPPGYPEIETCLPMMLDECRRGRLALPDLARLMAFNPASILGLQQRKGSIAVGNDADLVIADLDAEWTIGDGGYETKAGWSPFDGRVGKGRIETVVARGRVAWDSTGVTATPGAGEFLPGSLHRTSHVAVTR